MGNDLFFASGKIYKKARTIFVRAVLCYKNYLLNSEIVPVKPVKVAA